MREIRKFEILFWVEVRDFEVEDDSPVQGSHETNTKATSELGPYDTREQAITAIDEQKTELLQKDFWQLAENEPLANGGLWNDWKKHYRTYIIRPQETELSREPFESEPVAV